MSNSPRFACQTYSWQMSLDRFEGQVPHMMAVARAAGFTGFEAETVVLGQRWSTRSLQNDLRNADLRLAALCLVGQWRGERESCEERTEADAVLEAVASTPGALINLVMYPGPDRNDLRERQNNALACMRDIARRAADRGVVCTFHPNSPDGSVFRVASDYEYLFDNLDPIIGFTPDVGHIAAGGMDPIRVIREHFGRIRHVHIKDINAAGGWAATGTGALDIPAIVRTLVDGGYQQWIAFEDESALAEADPDAAVLAAGDYVRRILEPQLASRNGEST